MRRTEARQSRLILLAVVAVALWLRLTGLGYGLPAIYNMDEVAIMNRALAFATGDLNPHNFLYPTFYFYALFAWEGLAFGIGSLLGVFDSLAAFQREFFVDPSRLYLAGRALSVVCGALTVWAVYRLGTRLYGAATGWAGALFMAVAPFAVRDAHYVKHDVPVTLLIVLTHVILASVVVSPDRHRMIRPWVIAGAVAGLAMSTHYYAVFVALAIVAAALAGPGANGSWTWRDRFGRVAAAGAAATAAFIVASPFLLMELPTAWRDMVQNREIVMDRAVAHAGALASLGPYLSMLWTDAIGWPVAIAGAAGLVLAMAGDWRRGAILAVFPFTFLLFIANTVPASRYLNPVLPFMAVAAGLAVVRLAELAGRHAAWVTAGLAAAVAVPGLAASYQTGRFFQQTDTRTLAQAFIEREVPAGATVLIQPYSVPLRQSKEGLVEALRHTQGSEDRASIKFQLLLALDPYPAPAYRTIYLGEGGLDADKIYVGPREFEGAAGLAPLRALGVQFVVMKRSDGELNALLAPLNQALALEGRLLATFSPYRSDVDEAGRAAVVPFEHNSDARLDAALARPGPAIEVWRIR